MQLILLWQKINPLFLLVLDIAMDLAPHNVARSWYMMGLGPNTLNITNLIHLLNHG